MGCLVKHSSRDATVELFSNGFVAMIQSQETWRSRFTFKIQTEGEDLDPDLRQFCKIACSCVELQQSYNSEQGQAKASSLRHGIQETPRLSRGLLRPTRCIMAYPSRQVLLQRNATIARSESFSLPRFQHKDQDTIATPDMLDDRFDPFRCLPETFLERKTGRNMLHM